MSNCDTNKEDDESTMPGFRFHPTDEELVGFYLRRKVEKKAISIELIKQIDIYKFDPWDLPKVSSITGEKEWYFFCMRGRKYRNSVRPNRVTGSGFWKATGIDKPIHSDDHQSIVGLKKSLVYYRGNAGKGTKTDWMMHEFRLPSTTPPPSGKMATTMLPYAHAKNFDQEAEIWTLCRIFKRTTSYKKQPPGPKQTTIKCNAADSYSTTNSLESDIIDPHTAIRNSSFIEQPFERKTLASDHVDVQQYQLIAGQYNSVADYHQAQFPAAQYSSPWNLNGEAFFGEWDELTPVVEYAAYPLHMNDL